MHSATASELRSQINFFVKFLSGLCVATWFLMVLGGIVRAANAGLACPDWPLCFSKLIPHFDVQIFLEWFHRLVAGSLTLAIVYLFIGIFRSKALFKILGGPMIVCGVLLLVQIVLGGLTVLHLLEPKIVGAHLINAVFFFSTLLWMRYLLLQQLFGRSTELKQDRLNQLTRKLLPLAMVLLLAQIWIGGMVSSNYAGLACPDFPLCFGQLWPAFGFLHSIQMLHRLIAFALTFVLVLFAAMLYSQANLLTPALWRCARYLPTLVLAQIGLGVINVYFELPIWASALHLGNAVLMYAILLSACLDEWLLQAKAVSGHNPMTHRDLVPKGGV